MEEELVYEIYVGTSEAGHKKTYLVFFTKFIECANISRLSRKFFKCAAQNIKIKQGWIWNDELYFEQPNKKAKIVLAACWVGKKVN